MKLTGSRLTKRSIPLCCTYNLVLSLVVIKCAGSHQFFNNGLHKYIEA